MKIKNEAIFAEGKLSTLFLERLQKLDALEMIQEAVVKSHKKCSLNLLNIVMRRDINI